MSFRPFLFLFVVSSIAACHDRELASPYTGTLTRQEAAVVGSHLRTWADNVRSSPPGDGPVDPLLMPPVGYWKTACPAGGRFFQTWRHHRTWSDSTQVTTIASHGIIDQDECKYHVKSGVLIAITAEETLTYESRSRYVGNKPSGAFADQIKGSFSWKMPDGRRGKCAIDYLHISDWVAKTEKRSGTVCGHLFNETYDWSSPAALKER